MTDVPELGTQINQQVYQNGRDADRILDKQSDRKYWF